MKKYDDAVGPCPVCGKKKHWYNDVPLKAFCWGKKGEEDTHGEASCVVPDPHQPYGSVGTKVRWRIETARSKKVRFVVTIREVREGVFVVEAPAGVNAKDVKDALEEDGMVLGNTTLETASGVGLAEGHFGPETKVVVRPLGVREQPRGRFPADNRSAPRFRLKLPGDGGQMMAHRWRE